MSSAVPLLPANATALERATAVALADSVDLPIPVRELWNPDRCPLALLPYLAWAWSVDEWDSAWPGYRQRRAVKDALELHRQKGSVWAVKRVISNQGFILQRLIEHAGRIRLNGTCQLNGWHMPGSAKGWAMYRVILSSRRVTAAQKESLRRSLNAVAPARCLLVGIHYLSKPIQLNGTATIEGDYMLGSIYA
jgi:phage tail P2-like protein